MGHCVLVCGGRDYDDSVSMKVVLDALHERDGIDCIIHGAARGADMLAADWALSNGILCKAYPANWKELGAGAGPIRNQRMLESGKPDMVIAFPGGKGTADMVRRAEAAKVCVVKITKA